MIKGRHGTGPAIETAGLTKVYGKTVRALDALDMSVQQGEIFGFLGPNGAGKTTLIRLLLDLIRPTEGRASIFGLDCQKDSLKVRQLVGYLSSDIKLYEGFTGRRLLRFYADLRPGGVDWSYVEELNGELEVSLDRPVQELSRGNRQKVALLTALMHRPDLVILDEPTTGLDPLMQRAVLAILTRVRDEGRTVFFSSHILSEVEQICDRAAIIRQGRLATVESVSDLRSRKVQRIQITFGDTVPADSFTAIPGVTLLHQQGNTLELEVTGEADPVVKTAARHHVVSLGTVQPSLEDMFIRYYGPVAASEEKEAARG